MYPYKYKISIRLEHPSLDLTETGKQIHDLLPGVTLGRISVAGEERVSREGRRLGSRYAKSSIGFKFYDDMKDTSDQELEEAIGDTLIKLQPCEGLLRELAAKQGSIIFFVGVFIDKNSGIVLPPKLIYQLAESHVEMQFDVYPPDSPLS